MNNILRHALIPALAALCLTTAFAAEEPICGTWRFWDKSVREMRHDGSSGLPGRPGDSKWSRLSPPGMNEPVYQIKDGSDRAIETLALRNSGTQLWSVKQRKPTFAAARISDSGSKTPSAPNAVAAPGKSAPKKTAPASVPQPVNTPAPAAGQRQMAFAPDWMPNRQDISREFAKSLAFYCRFAVGDAARGNEPVPGAIIWNLTWLMPMMEAEARVPGVTGLQRDYEMNNPGFPHHSIHIRCLRGNFIDPASHELFNICNLICDARQQLIGVELRASNPKMVYILPPQVMPNKDPKALPASGVLEPFFDFIDIKTNASTTNVVEYQVTAAGRGVTVIQTILDSKKRGVIENVRWYLTAPFARKLLDMVEGR